MNIRLLDESDAVVYREIRLRSLRNNPEAFGSTYEQEVSKPLEATVRRIKSTNDRFTLGCFLDNGRLVGIVTFVRESDLKNAHKGNVYGMYIEPEMRGQGLGKSLMMALIEKAKERAGLEQINLTVVSSNESAKQLYSSLGFEVYGVERNALKFEGRYFDEDFMVLRM